MRLANREGLGPKRSSGATLKSHEVWPRAYNMLVIVTVSRLANDRIEIRVAKPQDDSNPVQEYPSETQARAVLLDFGISQEAVDSHLKLLAHGCKGAVEIPSDGCPTA